MSEPKPLDDDQKPEELKESETDEVAGGLNPQPLPPRFNHGT